MISDTYRNGTHLAEIAGRIPKSQQFPVRIPNTSIISVSGALLEQRSFLDELAAHVRKVHRLGRRVVLVHGGDEQIASLHEAVGMPTHKTLGLRVTPKASMELVTMVLCGLINKRLVALLSAMNVRCLGVSGADCGILISDLLNPDRLGRVGGPPRVDREALESLLDASSVLVMSPVCLGSDRNLVNVSAELSAQAIAVSLNASCLEFVVDDSDLGGVTTTNLSHHDIQKLLKTAASGSRVIPKLQAGLIALDGGVPTVRLGSPARLDKGTALEVRA